MHTVISFVHPNDPRATTRRQLIVGPQCIFRGTGLWLWGCDETTLVHQVKVGNLNCLSIARNPIPGLYFEAGATFEDFVKLVDGNFDDVSLCDGKTCRSNSRTMKSLPPLPPHQRIDMPVAEIGNQIVLDVEGPLTHAVMWGLTVS